MSYSLQSCSDFVSLLKQCSKLQYISSSNSSRLAKYSNLVAKILSTKVVHKYSLSTECTQETVP